MRSGWFHESHRHYLAAKGIKTRYNVMKPISLRPRFAEGLLSTYEDLKQMGDTGDYLWTTREARERKRRAREKELERVQTLRSTFGEDVVRAPPTSEELQRIKMRERELLSSARVRAELSRRAENEQLKAMESYLMGVGGEKVYDVQQQILKGEITPGVEKWMSEAKKFLDFLEVKRERDPDFGKNVSSELLQDIRDTLDNAKYVKVFKRETVEGVPLTVRGKREYMPGESPWESGGPGRKYEKQESKGPEDMTGIKRFPGLYTEESDVGPFTIKKTYPYGKLPVPKGYGGLYKLGVEWGVETMPKKPPVSVKIGDVTEGVGEVWRGVKSTIAQKRLQRHLDKSAGVSGGGG